MVNLKFQIAIILQDTTINNAMQCDQQIKNRSFAYTCTRYTCYTVHAVH